MGTVLRVVGFEVLSGQTRVRPTGGQPQWKGVCPRWDNLRSQPRSGPIVKLFKFLGKREQASVVSIEGGHCPGVPWIFFEISGLLLHLKNKKNSTMTDTNEEKN